MFHGDERKATTARFPRRKLSSERKGERPVRKPVHKPRQVCQREQIPSRFPDGSPASLIDVHLRHPQGRFAPPLPVRLGPNKSLEQVPRLAFLHRILRLRNPNGRSLTHPTQSAAVFQQILVYLQSTQPCPILGPTLATNNKKYPTKQRY